VTSSAMEVTIGKWFAAPRELVFRAFTEPRLLEQWFCPSPEVALRVEQCDVRPSGKFRLIFYFPGNRVVPVIGEYQTVKVPEKLVYTWTWEDPDPWAGVVTLVTVDFRDLDGGTDVVIHHSRFTTQEMKQMHEAGWPPALSRLDSLVSQFEKFQ